MLTWIAKNAASIITVAVLLTVIGAAVLSLVRDKKRHSASCTGNCASCGMNCSCKNERK